MTKQTLPLLALSVLLFAANARSQSLRDYADQANHFMNGQGNGNNNNQNSNNQNSQYSAHAFDNISGADITSALREALQVGAKNAVGRLSAPNGFFGNSLIKILMPPDAKKVETTLREVGMGDQVDKAILTMNRAAEDASAKAIPIFIDAITHMSIDDGIRILRGGNDAATQYLKAKTSAALTAAFKPVIKTSLDKVEATKYWADIFNAYNQLPTTFKKVNPDLPDYVTERALNGLFVAMAEEEGKIRLNPDARTTQLLQEVFGAH
jgi:hypothetical protein